MDALTVTFTVATWIAKGVANGTFERYGGTIREVASGRIVTFLKEIGSNSDVKQQLNVIDNLVRGNIAVSVINAAATAVTAAEMKKGFAGTNNRLDEIGQQLGFFQQGMRQVQGTLQITTAANMLTLGISVLGFAVIAQRISELERRLQEAQETLNKINRKIDLGFYANFRAALDLAANAFTMSRKENRERSAMQAIDRFLEAQHIYTRYSDEEIALKSAIADEYLLTLTLAYLAEARCYLELEELDTARRRLKEGSKVIRSRIEKYVEMFLTSNPAAYLDPQLKEQVDLRRLTKIYQWLDPSLDENAVFQMHRSNLVNFIQDQNKWISSLPTAIWNPPLDWAFKAIWDDPKPEIFMRLAQAMNAMESLVEANRRFESYRAEIQAISELGMDFQHWNDLTPTWVEERPDDASLIFITPAQPMEMAA